MPEILVLVEPYLGTFLLRKYPRLSQSFRIMPTKLGKTKPVESWAQGKNSCLC